MIIHNAWRLDFNLSLSSFTPQIASVATLAHLALRSPHQHPPRILFTSSVATVSSWSLPTPVPEEPLHDLRVAVGNGYGESKAVAERILEKVSSATSVKTTNFRIGQLSGSSGSGAWATSDWVPLIARGGQEIGSLPDGSGVSGLRGLVDGRALTMVFVHSARHLACHRRRSRCDPRITTYLRTDVAHRESSHDVMVFRHELTRCLAQFGSSAVQRVGSQTRGKSAPRPRGFETQSGLGATGLL